MSYPSHVWKQLKNKTCDELISALLKDGFERIKCKGAVHTYLHSDDHLVTIHYHPRKTYRPKLLKKLLNDIGWTVEDMKRLKLIK